MSAIKPPSYWNDFRNVERELRAFIAEHGEAGTMPDYVELGRAGYKQLSFAIGRYGSFETVAQRLGLQWRHRRKPKGYWSDFGNLEKELRAIIADLGQPGIMPTTKQLRAIHRAELVPVIRRHGGREAVAERLGLELQRPARPRPQTDPTGCLWHKRRR